MNLVTRYLGNFSMAAEIKLKASTYFSPPIAAFVEHIASNAQMHDGAMAICLINIVAVTSQSSVVKRQHIDSVPMNLYNSVVARSSKRLRVLDSSEQGGNSRLLYLRSSEVTLSNFQRLSRYLKLFSTTSTIL